MVNRDSGKPGGLVAPAPALVRRFTPPVPGDVIPRDPNRYTIGAQLGAGAFGSVWECTDRWGNHLVAKVVLPNDLPFEAVRSKWTRETGVLLHLRHPNITFLHDAFQYRDTFYLILERCSSTLADLLAWPKLQGQYWVVPVARCVLQAVDFIHRAGFVHKDLHPGNLFTTHVRDEMTPWVPGATTFKVGDLGISGPITEVDWFHTRLAQWMLPPEVLNPAEFGAPGKSVDIYHCGLMLLSLLVGKELTFTEEEALHGVPRLMAERIGTPLAIAISQGLRRHTAERPQSAMDYWELLSAAGAQGGLL